MQGIVQHVKTTRNLKNDLLIDRYWRHYLLAILPSGFLKIRLRLVGWLLE